MFYFFVITAVILMGLAEIILSNFNIVFPVLLFGCFYLSAVAYWPRVIVPMIVMSALVDAALLRNIPSASIGCVIIVILAGQWCRRWDIYSFIALLLMGMIIGLLRASFLALEMLCNGMFFNTDFCRHLLICIVLGAFVLPGMCFILNFFAEIFDLRELKRSHASILHENAVNGDQNGENDEN